MSVRSLAIFETSLLVIAGFSRCFTWERNTFGLIFFAQFISQLHAAFMAQMCARLSNKWFKSTELSSATAVGVAGLYLGTGLCYIIPPLIVTGPSISNRVWLNWVVASYSLLYFIARVKYYLFGILLR